MKEDRSPRKEVKGLEEVGTCFDKLGCGKKRRGQIKYKDLIPLFSLRSRGGNWVTSFRSDYGRKYNVPFDSTIWRRPW
jgi:hypothetical protein